MQATPSWSEIKPPPLHARCSNFRFVIWIGTLLLLLTAAIGLSVVMVVVKNNRDDSDSSSGGGDSGSGGSSGGHGGGGSSGGGSGGGSIPPVNVVPFTPPPGKETGITVEGQELRCWGLCLCGAGREGGPQGRLRSAKAALLFVSLAAEYWGSLGHSVSEPWGPRPPKARLRACY